MFGLVVLMKILQLSAYRVERGDWLRKRMERSNSARLTRFKSRLMANSCENTHSQRSKSDCSSLMLLVDRKGLAPDEIN